MNKEKECPKTVEEAVERLLKELSDKDKAEIAADEKGRPYRFVFWPGDVYQE